MSRKLAAASAVLILGAASACGSGDESSADSGDTTSLTVYAASSLTSAFTEIGKTFESAHPGVTVTFSFAGSADLLAQLEQGAPADLFASADTATMDGAGSDDLLDGGPVDFASNTLEIAVPPGNPASISTFADLAKPGVKLVICAPEVPCGAAAQQVAEVAKQTLQPVSEEASVTDVLAKVESGEADAGLVYVTDVLAAGDDVAGITFPESAKVVNTYPIAVLSSSAHHDVAQQFVDQVTGTSGQKVLADFGFGRP